MRTAMCRRLACLLLAVVPGACAFAASFDCAKAKTPMERAICANPKLSQLDERMAAAYQQALRALSAEGASGLKASQLSWLRYAGRVCVPRERAGARPEAEVACLARELQQRVARLADAGLRLGAHVLTRIDRYEVSRAPPNDATGRFAGLVVRHFAYPQIDRPGPAAAAWNRAQAKALQEADPKEPDATDYDVDYVVGCASEGVLSIEWTESVYAHGTPHGDWAISTSTILLQPEVHALRAVDLFAPRSDWESRLPAMFWEAHLRDEPDQRDNEVLEKAIRAAAADAGRWLLTPEGLRIAFSAYEGGSYAGTPGPITVPWAALQPLLGAQGAPRCGAGR